MNGVLFERFWSAFDTRMSGRRFVIGTGWSSVSEVDRGSTYKARSVRGHDCWTYVSKEVKATNGSIECIWKLLLCRLFNVIAYSSQIASMSMFHTSYTLVSYHWIQLTDQQFHSTYLITFVDSLPKMIHLLIYSDQPQASDLHQ